VTAEGTRPVSIPVGVAALDGDLVLPDPGRGLVVFAHGSGSGRHSPATAPSPAPSARRGSGRS
jgi:hypothetical protein